MKSLIKLCLLSTALVLSFNSFAGPVGAHVPPDTYKVNAGNRESGLNAEAIAVSKSGLQSSVESTKSMTKAAVKAVKPN